MVIGNPPYVFTRDVEFDGNFKKYIEDEYFSKMIRGKKSKSNQSGKINLFAIFIVKGLFVSCENGYLTYIIPNNILRTTTYDVVRRYLLENFHIEQIVDLGSGVFDNVTASTVVLGLSKKLTTSNTKVITEINSIEKYDFSTKVFDQSQFLENVSYSFNIYMDELSMEISKVIASNKKALEWFCVDNIEGIVAHKHLIFDSEGSNRFPLIEGKDIKRYSIRKPSNFLLWDTKEIHRTRPDYLWESEKKIIIQRISGGTKPLVCAVDLNRYKSFASTNNLILKEKFSNHYYFFAAIINSDVINWYYANNFSNNSNLTVNISKTYMDQLPIAEFSTSVSLISEILHNTSIDSYFTQFSKVLNAFIFNLYFPEHMKEREIDVLEFADRDIAEVIHGREFEKLSEAEREQVIEQLHATWSHPDNEIRNRIKLFAVRSPEILKPILES
ncbi:MAG: TaqI-like C-terminal specificity domain-containing protein [Fulvivirga sp.]